MMNLDEAMRFTGSRKAEGFRSDGCTLAPDLGIKEFCEMHDALKVYKPVTAFEAGNLFFKGICSKGYRYWPVAVVYWSAVQIQSKIGTGGAVSAFVLINFLVIALIYSD